MKSVVDYDWLIISFSLSIFNYILNFYSDAWYIHNGKTSHFMLYAKVT